MAAPNLLVVILALACAGPAAANVGPSKDEKIRKFMDKVNVSAPGVVREEGASRRSADEFQSPVGVP